MKKLLATLLCLSLFAPYASANTIGELPLAREDEKSTVEVCAQKYGSNVQRTLYKKCVLNTYALTATSLHLKGNYQEAVERIEYLIPFFEKFSLDDPYWAHHWLMRLRLVRAYNRSQLGDFAKAFSTYDRLFTNAQTSEEKLNVAQSAFQAAVMAHSCPRYKKHASQISEILRVPLPFQDTKKAICSKPFLTTKEFYWLFLIASVMMIGWAIWTVGHQFHGAPKKKTRKKRR